MPYIFKLGKFWLLMVFVVVCVYFGLNNQQPISVNVNPLLANDITMPAYRIHFASFLVGASFAILFFGFEHIRKSLEIRRLTKKLAVLEPDELDESSTYQPASDSSGLSEINKDSLVTAKS